MDALFLNEHAQFKNKTKFKNQTKNKTKLKKTSVKTLLNLTMPSLKNTSVKTLMTFF